MGLFKKVILFMSFCIMMTGTNLAADYYPSDSWRMSTPEEQGVDSEKLYQMLSYVKEQNINLHSILVIRNGYLIHETYFHPYHRDNAQNIHSCTKSFTSALLGIALNEGKINNLDQKVMEFFPEKKIVNPDPRLEQLSIKHLLTMATGMDWEDKSRWYQMRRSKDWVETILNTPFKEEPGLVFTYNSGASHLLSAIIQQSTGMTTLDYAQEHLFKPLNMQVYWGKDPGGITNGAAGLFLKPTDLAKFGFLFLNKGKWDGKQIVPGDWVESSTQKHLAVFPYLTGYGYQWWINSFGGYSARGWGGQYIVVLPKQNMVVVVTSGEDFRLKDLIEPFILPAVKQEQPLVPNPQMEDQIKQLSDFLEHPEQLPIKTLPQFAELISGKVFVCEPNIWGIRTFTLNFKKGPECEVKVELGKETISCFIGMDGIYRYNKINGNNVTACRGSWRSDQTLVLDWQEMSQTELFRFIIIFSDNQINVVGQGSVEKSIRSFQGKLIE